MGPGDNDMYRCHYHHGAFCACVAWMTFQETKNRPAIDGKDGRGGQDGVNDIPGLTAARASSLPCGFSSTPLPIPHYRPPSPPPYPLRLNESDPCLWWNHDHPKKGTPDPPLETPGRRGSQHPRHLL